MDLVEKKKDRSGALAAAAVAACFVAAYGFSHKSALFQWVLPVLLVGATALWAYWPRRPGEQTTRQGA
jgi:hypothetical protein